MGGEDGWVETSVAGGGAANAADDEVDDLTAGLEEAGLEEDDFAGGGGGGVLRTRTYDLSITYDKCRGRADRPSSGGAVVEGGSRPRRGVPRR